MNSISIKHGTRLYYVYTSSWFAALLFGNKDDKKDLNYISIMFLSLYYLIVNKKELFNYIEKILISLNSVYQHFSFECVINGKKQNLNRVEVKDLSITHNLPYYLDFFDLINNFKKAITESLKSQELQNIIVDEYIPNRIKNNNSIFYKIYNYNHRKGEHGSVPINKCLNDLMGFRIYVPCRNINKLKAIVVDVATKNSINCKITNASKMKYKAVHLYLIKDNTFFRWEIQFWPKNRVNSNIESHAQYKQGYTNWENSYNFRSLIEGIK